MNDAHLRELQRLQQLRDRSRMRQKALAEEIADLKAERDRIIQRSIILDETGYDCDEAQGVFFSHIDAYTAGLADRMEAAASPVEGIEGTLTFLFCHHCLDSVLDMLRRGFFVDAVTEDTMASIQSIDYEQLDFLCTSFLCHRAYTESLLILPSLDVQPKFVHVLAQSEAARLLLAEYQAKHKALEDDPDLCDLQEEDLDDDDILDKGARKIIEADRLLEDHLADFFALRSDTPGMFGVWRKVTTFAHYYIASMQEGFRPRLTTQLPERVRWLDVDKASRYRTGSEIHRMLPSLLSCALVLLALLAVVAGIVYAIWYLWPN